MAKPKANPEQLRRARVELVSWMIEVSSLPQGLADACLSVLADELLEEELEAWMADITCNHIVEPPLFDYEGLRAKMLNVPHIPAAWDSFARHEWRCDEKRHHGRRLAESMARVTKGAQRAALRMGVELMDSLERQERPTTSSCGLDQCPHCSATRWRWRVHSEQHGRDLRRVVVDGQGVVWGQFDSALARFIPSPPAVTSGPAADLATGFTEKQADVLFPRVDSRYWLDGLAVTKTALYVNTESGLFLLEKDQWDGAPAVGRITDFPVAGLTVAPSGGVSGLFDGGVIEVTGDQWRWLLRGPQSYRGDLVVAHGWTTSGDLIVATPSGLKNRSTEESLSTRGPGNASLEAIEQIQVGPTDQLWAIVGGRLYSLLDEAWTGHGEVDGLGDDWVRALEVGPNGSIWAGGQGVSYFDGERWTTIASELWVFDLACGSGGHVWAGSSRGLAELLPPQQPTLV